MINRWYQTELWKKWLSRFKDWFSNINWGKVWLRIVFPFLLTTFFVIFTTGCDTAATDCSTDTFLVTTTEDISDGLCNEHCTLREAVAAANTCSAHDIYPIELPAGTYTLTTRGPGDDRGDLNFLTSSSIFGESAETTIIEGDSSWNNRIISVEEGANLHLENLTIRGGNQNLGFGGGVLNRGVLTMRDVLLEDNSAMIGGGLFNAFSTTLNQVQFIGNEALSPPGLSAAEEEVYRETEFFDDCGGGFANTGSMTVSESMIRGNSAGSGGGVCNGGLGTLTIRESSIQNNESPIYIDSSEGGGIYNSGSLTLENSQVTGNSAHNGGGIFQGGPRGDTFDYSHSGTLNLEGVLIQENTAESAILTADVLSLGQGGGLHISGGEFAITNSSILDNQAREGGGVYLGEWHDSEGYFLYATLARNDASGHIAGVSEGKGGGIYGQGEVELTNVTFSANTDDLGGGAAYITGGNFLFFHNTVAFNSSISTGGTVGGIEIISGRATIWNSLIVGATCGSSSGSGGDYYDGVNICESDASPHIFSELTLDNGQWVHVLLVSSRAIDLVPTDGVCPVYDQRGTERPQGARSRCDVGAYEFAPFVMSGDLGSPTLNTDVICREGPGPLYDTVSSVLAGTQVTLLGRTIEMNWWIIDNPRYPGVACWLPGDALDVPPDLDLSQLQYLAAPLLPTIVPSATGCLYQGPNDNVASCYDISQCPVPFAQSLGACTP